MYESGDMKGLIAGFTHILFFSSRLIAGRAPRTNFEWGACTSVSHPEKTHWVNGWGKS